MRSSRARAIAALAAALCCGAAGRGDRAGAEAAAPRTAPEGLALGRAVGRALVSFQTLDMCAIPVLVARCRSDFDAFVGGDEAAFARVPGLGPAPLEHMRSYFANGDPADFPRGFATIRTATAPNALWKSERAAAWAMDAGIVDETVDASLHDETGVYAVPPVTQMLHAARDGGADASLLGADAQAPDRPFQASLLDRLARGIDERHPAAPLPDLPEAYGSRGDVYLGIGYATVFQMCDAPEVAALPESQAFFDRFFTAAARFSSVPEAGKRLSAIRDGLRFAHGLDRPALLATIADLVRYQNALPGATLRRTLIGQFASQIGYNATVQRDPTFLPTVARNITRWRDADDDFPGLARRRVALALLDANDFGAQRRASMALVGFLLLDAKSK